MASAQIHARPGNVLSQSPRFALMWRGCRQRCRAALEYAPRGIRINAVCPVTIETPMVADMIAKASSTRPTPPPRHRSATSARARRSLHPSCCCAVPEPASSSASPYPSTAAADRSAASDPVEPRHAVRPAIRWPAAAASADGASPGEAQPPRGASGRRPEHLPQCWNRCNRFRSTTHGGRRHGGG